MPTIDNLQIDINAQATRANDAVDRLAEKLDRLTTSLSRVEGSKLTGLANGVQKLGNAMQTMGNVKTTEFSKLARNLKNLSTIDTAAINRASSSVTLIAKSFRGLTGLSKSAEQLGQLANGIKQLGYKSAGQAIDNIPNLAAAMRQLMNELSKAPRVSQNLIDMTNALAKLSRTGASSGRAANSIAKSLDTYTASTHRASKGSFSLASAIGKVYASYWLLFRAFGGIRKAIDISSDLTEVQNVVDVTFGDMSSKVEEFAQNSIQNLGMSELSVKSFASRFQAMGMAMGIDPSLIGSANKYLSGVTDGYVGLSDSMADVSLNLTKLTADMASFYNVEQAVAAEDLAAIFTGETRPLRDYGIDLTQATLAEWAMKQGMDANIQSMSQAEKTMLRYQYVMANTGAAQRDFIRTQDTWANQVRILKEQIRQLASVIGGVFINALKPLVKALNVAMSHIIEFAKTIANALGKIFGWQYEVGGGGMTQDFAGAAGSAEDIADSTGQAADNIKKMQAGLRAFDELKVINMPEAGGGNGGAGGGGGGAAGGGASGGQWVKGESMLENFESEIDTLFELGEYIGKTLTDAMNSIDWKKVYEGAKNFGKGLADFLNGLISPDLFGAVGKTIAGALNTAIYAALSFGETFEFEEFGLSIAEGINQFFETFDFASLAQTINVWVQGIWSTIKTALANIDWGKVWNGVKEFLENIDLETVAIIIGAITIKKILGLHLAKSVFSWIGTAISGKIAQAIASKLGVEIAANAGIGTALKTGIGAKLSGLFSGIGLTVEGLFSGLGLKDALVAGFGSVGPIVAGIASSIGGAVLAVKSFFDMWNNGWSWLKEILKDIGIALAAVGAVLLGVAAAPAAIVAAVVAAVSTIAIVIHDNWEVVSQFFVDLWNNIVDIWNKASTWFNENVITPIVNFFKGLWEKVSGFFSNLWEDIVSVWNSVSEWFSNTVIEPIVNFFVGFAKRVKQIFEGLWIIIQAIWMTVSKAFNEHIITPITDAFTNFIEGIKEKLNILWEGIKTVWSTVSNLFNEYVITPIVNLFSEMVEKIKNSASESWEKIKSIWSEAWGFFNDIVIEPVLNAFQTACDKIGEFFSGLWSGIKQGVAGAMNAVIGGIESGINFIVNGINKIIGGFNKVVSWAAGVVGTDWGGVDLVPNVSIPRIQVQGYELGGFPKPYSLFAAGEGGVPELMGTVGGKTAVAGGMEITGIRDEIRETSAAEVQLLREQNQLLRALLDKEFGITKDEIGRSAQGWARDYSRRTGRPAYDF